MVVMETSVFLAKFWGYLLLVIGIVFLLKKKTLESTFAMLKDKTFVMLSGYMALILGLVTVLMHNLWVSDWRVIVTIFGWFSTLKGVARLGWPEKCSKNSSMLKKKGMLINVFLVVCIALGAYLVWVPY